MEVLPAGSLGQHWPEKPEVPSHILTSFLLARLRSIATASATKLGYREFEPYYISTPLQNRDSGPVSVSFEGWGSSLSLAISPAPQLLQTLLETGEHRVFAVGRCFSSAYRDGFSSAEELTLVARQIDTSIEEVICFSETILRDLLQEGDTAVSRVTWGADQWPQVPVAAMPSKEIDTPRIEWLPEAREDDGIHHAIFRIIYPQGIVVAEGDVTEWSSHVRIGGVTVHLERLVALLSPTRLAAIRDLGAPTERLRRA
ncbi:hypothetical protein F7Q99_21545 [Streptomyces kaniharaensis]|uniref:Uncharacterized protein n=1 Tax=Streptomyces kaniharaensis TaxID=212423 RepID=A0A6N7KXS4_9ACTN|nr:hypothetical protein [Streptomyces kaniharaensis]MQS14774.1 hypothetical protein [Streptomyces kaniharaensis]